MQSHPSLGLPELNRHNLSAPARCHDWLGLEHSDYLHQYDT